MAHAVINGPALRDFLESDTGPVAREMIRRGILVQNRARQLCPVDGGRLRASITWELIHTSGWLIVRVGSNVEYACILGSHASIAIEGPPGAHKTIGQIQVGDRVLTQSGDFRAVVATNSFPATEKPDMVEIVTPWRSDRDHVLTVTADHKLLVERDGRMKWVEAGDLTGADLLQTRRKQVHNAGTGAIKICEHCSGEYRNVHGQGQGRRFCGLACRNAFWKAHDCHPTRNRVWTEEERQNHAVVQRQRLRDQPDTHPNRNQSRVSEQEITVGAWLTMRGLTVIPQPHVAGLWPDFYVESEHRIYEADGAFWHKDQQKDIERDKQLQVAMPGVEIVHIHFYDERHSPKPLDPNPLPGVWYVPVNPSPTSYVEPTTFVGAPAKSIRAYRYHYTGKPGGRVHRLYDLSVEGEHSFLASGILVSNSYVERGTGIYGPSGTPIRPRNSQYLVFTPKGAPGPVFARQVRGRPATPFLEPALDAGLEEGRPRRSSAS